MAFERLKETFAAVDDVGLACLYFNYQKPMTPTEIIANVLKQVLEGNINVSPEVKSLYESHERRETRPSLNELVSLLATESDRYTSCFVVLDALDECTEKDNTGVKVVSELQKIPNVRFMVTGRPHVEKLLSRYSAAKLEIRARDEDIRRSLESDITESSIIFESVQTDETLRRTVIEAVVSKAKGMYVIFIVKSLV
jgi:hypothetical protein